MRSLLTTALLAIVLPTCLSGQEIINRFAVFSPERVIEVSGRAKKLFSEMEAVNKKLSEKLKAKNDELVKKDQQLKSPSLSEEGRAKLQRELQDGEISFKRLQEDSQLEFQKVQAKAMGEFEKEISPILEEIGKEMKLQMLIRYNPQIIIPIDANSVASFSDEVAKRYDKKFGVATTAAKPATKK